MYSNKNMKDTFMKQISSLLEHIFAYVLRENVTCLFCLLNVSKKQNRKECG